MCYIFSAQGPSASRTDKRNSNRSSPCHHPIEALAKECIFEQQVRRYNKVRGGENNPYQQAKPFGTFLPQELMTRLMATGTLNFRMPNTLALIAVHKHNAASRSASPSKTAQQLLLGFVPITSWTSPSQSPQTPNLRVSFGHLAGFTGVVEGGKGAGSGVVEGGEGAGFGVEGGKGAAFGGHGT